MTTTDMPETPTPEPPPVPPRILRRSRDSRVAAGVSGGLGEYFGVDPVLFRVLFATSAFFGGAGILAYLLAWAAIPEKGTESAPIDGMIAQLRRRQIPPWAVAVGIGVVVWAVAFSWWSPGPFVPVVAVVVLLAVIFGRRELQGREPQSGPATVDLTKHPDTTPTTSIPLVDEVRTWWQDSHAASRQRARRALPVKIAALGGLAATLITLAIVDAASGIPIPVYFWVGLGFVGAGLVVGLLLRRTPWSIATLLVPIVGGLVAFAGTPARLHDGIGERTWTPTVRPAAEYRLAFGQGTLDLRMLPTQTTPRTVRVVAAAGQIRVIVGKDDNVAFRAVVRFGRVDTLTGSDVKIQSSGTRPGYEVPAPAGASGARTTVVVQLADGHVELARR